MFMSNDEVLAFRDGTVMVVSGEQLADAKDWLADVAPIYRDGDPVDLEAVTVGEIYAYVNRLYDGGWAQFVKDSGR